jgi:hypothetical protein
MERVEALRPICKGSREQGEEFVNIIANTPLAKPLRSQLETTVKTAREVAEKAAFAALTQLAVGEVKAPDYLTDDLKALRRRMRAHGRALGDVKQADDSQAITHLVWEVAYEHWHRMLFARFLAENHLLMWEPGAAVSLDDCRDMVDNHPDMAMGAKSHWELAGKLAARMLPQVFKPKSPVFELSFAPEHQRALERLLAGLSAEVFKASDSLGWVYQFWQAQRKEAINKSEVKIGADELPAVTQLFTEPYMVDFLLHNSLGAWWVTRHPDTPCPVLLTYLRKLEDGTPAAGKFEGWPDTLTKFKLLDPCCGSGHFLVAAFLMLVPMRIMAEGLTAMDAVDLVLKDNLHGLEIDPRCVEIAVFALALAAWRFGDEEGNALGVRADMPSPNVACCGLSVGKESEWLALAEGDEHLRLGMKQLYDTFQQAPLLGSLLDPSRSNKGDLFSADYRTLTPLLFKALDSHLPKMTCESPVGGPLVDWYAEGAEGYWETTWAAKGLAEAARLLDDRYHLVITNVPYLSRGKQNDMLKEYCETYYPDAKNDLASVFIVRCLELAKDGCSICIVSPQNWWFLASYASLRKRLLIESQFNFLAALGEEAWQHFGNRGPLATLLLGTNSRNNSTSFSGLNAISAPTIDAKISALLTGSLLALTQASQLRNPDARIVLQANVQGNTLLQEFAESYQGITTGDNPRFIRCFWEISEWAVGWLTLQSTGESSEHFVGREQLFHWEEGRGPLAASSAARVQGQVAWNLRGVAVRQVRDLAVTLNTGSPWDMNTATLIPRDPTHLPAIWCFCSSPEFGKSVRQIDQALKVTNATLVKVPFDIDRWQRIATDRYPNGLPKPYSDTPTQWLFHGHPKPSTNPLQVVVARLAGYNWLAETDTNMELSNEASAWLVCCGKLAAHIDDDGIVCLPSVRGEKSAHDRLLDLLIDAWETVEPGSWKTGILDKLLTDADSAGKGLDIWLREKFFEQHSKLFHHRPFIWHIWDGLKDGFGALVNYHTLDTKNLERLIHTYLGDWIRQQEAGVRDGVDGAQTRLAAAQVLKKKLELILEGEAPYDIFVRWKPLEQQPIGWNPDLNDGVRMNIRPFMTAEVLRHNKKPKLNITWDKDRGKDVESAPWYHKFGGERINDHHLTLAEKRAARTKAVRS